jgi:hypothetical protein
MAMARACTRVALKNKPTGGTGVRIPPPASIRRAPERMSGMSIGVKRKEILRRARGNQVSNYVLAENGPGGPGLDKS